MSSPVAADPGAGEAHVIRHAGDFDARDARELSRRVTTAVASGARKIVVDLTEAPSVQEVPLLLTMLSVRAALRRADGRLVVAMRRPLATRFSMNLRMDPALDAAGSVEEAVHGT